MGKAVAVSLSRMQIPNISAMSSKPQEQSCFALGLNSLPLTVSVRFGSSVVQSTLAFLYDSIHLPLLFGSNISKCFF